jgi:predicted transcriptional regulator
MADIEGTPVSTKNMTLRLDPELAARVEALAEIESIPMAQVVRDALSSHVERRKREPEFQNKLKIQLARQSEIERMFHDDGSDTDPESGSGSVTR